VRVRKGPHETARLVGRVEIGAYLESMQRFENDAEGEEDQQSPPAELEMMAHRW
jgi:hypothetical protein